MASENKRTYYKRTLPSPPAIAFSSAEGRAIFAEALPLGYMVGFFKLIEQFTTQEEPQYCGLAALSMTFNALGIDPRRTWKGAWRWFSETLLDCCKSMEEVKRDGITLNQAASIACCNGADVSIHRYGTFSGSFFRSMLREACSSEDIHVVVSYSRKTFLQSGDGHFSPVGGYHPGRDLVLILDVARFKYAPHWVRVDDLMEAMSLLDPAIGRPRGFLVLSSRVPRESALFAVTAPARAAAAETTRSAPRESASMPVSAIPRVGASGSHVPVAAASATLAVSEPVVSNFDTCATSDSRTADCSTGSQGEALEPAWAAALRFVSRDAPELMRRLLAGSATAQGSGTGDEEHDDEGGEAEGDADEAAEGGPAAAAAAGPSGSSASVPPLESFVEVLVEAAPVDSICALLQRLRPAGSVDQGWTAPCCSCPGASGGQVTASAVEVAFVAPCNRVGCCRGSPLTKEAVATVAASAVQAAPGVAVSSSSESDVGSLESAGPSDSSFGSTGSLGSASAGSATGSTDSAVAETSGGSSGRCCHGEPLEHHCVPNQVQTLVADELRFTNMYKLVSYYLRRHRGCPHAQPPDISAFMQPAMAAAKPAPVPTPPATADAAVAPAGPAAEPASSPPAGCAAPSSQAPVSAPPAQQAASMAPGCSDGSKARASPSEPCGCGDLGLPEMAAEKLAALLLLLPADGDWWPASPAGSATGADGDVAASAVAGGPMAASGRVRVCGRPQCRRCRRRAAAAGDRAAALEVLRERWGQVLRLAPLGLFASSPVLEEELSFIRVQLAAAAPTPHAASVPQATEA